MRGRLVLKKINGLLNPADVMTKPKTARDLIEQIGRLGGDLQVRVRD